MSKFPKITIDNIKTISIQERKSGVHISDFARVFHPKTQDFHAFAESLPDILVSRDLKLFVNRIAQAFDRTKPIVVLMGGHVIKVGLSPLLVDLIRRRIVSAVAMNGAASIHDVETALWGKTSEDVAEAVLDGSFGMSGETGEFINSTLVKGYRDSDMGYGEALGKQLCDVQAVNRNLSILASGYELNIPITVHIAIGTDIVHQQPTMDGAATGEMSFRDFRLLCNVIKDLGDGGVVMNFGSAVVMPEVFLKALTVVRNLGYPVRRFTTANFDMIQHYRPRVNVVQRPTQDGGQGFQFTGHHEIMIPLLAAMIKDRIG